MSDRQGKVITGLCTLAALLAVWVLFDRSKSESRMNAPESVEVDAQIKASPRADVGNDFTDILPPDDPMFDQSAEIEQLTRETEIELETPQEQEAAQYARVTANMSMAQLAELQKFRQGAVVRNIDGQLKHPYTEAEKCDAENVCKATIINTRSNETVWDGNWIKGYAMTGVGMEVVKIGVKG